jgi:hypothetical protein
MKKSRLSKGLVAVVILILLNLAVQPSVALTQPNIENKPDLVITDIIVEKLEYRNSPWPEFYFYCRVKNIGNTPVEKTIEVTISAFKCVLLFPIAYVDTFQGQSKTGKILKPGETVDIYFANDFDFLNLGVYLFCAKVNTRKIIDESNYDNNYYRERAINLGLSWIDF